MAAGSEHTFPISAAEQRKLDELKEVIRHPPMVRKSSWLVVSLTGFVLLRAIAFWVRRSMGR